MIVFPLSSLLFVEGLFSYNRPHRFDRRCHFKKESNDRDDYMRTVHKGSLMPAAIGATAIAWIARVLSERLVADRGDRERFYENYSDAGRRWKRSKLYYTWCINITRNSTRPHNQRGRRNNNNNNNNRTVAAITVEFINNQALFMEGVRRSV